MKPFLFVLLVISLMLAGCARARGIDSNPTPPAETASVEAIITDETVAEELTAARGEAYSIPNDGSMVVTQDIYYGDAEEGTPAAVNLNSLDIYAPPDADSAPVMVMIHGGGWQIGDKANRGLLENKVPFFTGNGWLFVSINYRLSPDVQHPAHVEDVAKALAWIETNIRDYGGDPSQLYLMGHSAGAHLAALVATDEQYLGAEGLELDALSGVILLDGAGYNLETQAEFARGRAAEMYQNAFGNDPAVWADASPINHVEVDKGIPRFLIMYVVRRDPSRLQSERLAGALEAAGVPFELFPADDKTHMTINQEFGQRGDAVTEAAWAWLLRD